MEFDTWVRQCDSGIDNQELRRSEAAATQGCQILSTKVANSMCTRCY